MKDKSIIFFIFKVYIELRQIIWPKCQETLQMTLIVTIVTTILSFILWGLDSIIIYIISFITGLRF
ncbi:preprotein translocase subunit SecE [Candidatus Mikella endobia]|uniref:preprotein translocase subunit SecE n=1 Tax=Candidatus Mikella endobia TaxID=1778264 RepID=UPI00082BDD93